MMTLAMGSGAARLIGVASIPILTRIYSPEDFGALASFTVLVSMISPVLTLRYVVALPLPRRDGMAMNLMALSASIMGIMALIVTVGLWLLAPLLMGLLSMEVLVPYWWLIALGVTAAGVYELLSTWATRRKAYITIAKTEVLQSLSGSLLKIGLGLLALKPIGLLVGQVVARP
ncbi:hypothetical protein CKO42_26465 [Lamprobacter modestohalophilus]|uniref:Oligosaccharide flippase family protein n=2 Tax=Lamprobacter modestohalophilus TaxID=1064514 RepID=A0A9X0WEC9_9GAMM|nr:hypothetical protein [Lamprobacter modestohalophilus]